LQNLKQESNFNCHTCRREKPEEKSNNRVKFSLRTDWMSKQVTLKSELSS
jgi:hypothetical protein